MSLLDVIRSTDLADRRAIVFTEVGNSLEVRHQESRQPHHFNIAARFTLKTVARLNSVEIAVDIELQ